MNSEEKNMSNQPNDPGRGRRDFLKKGAAVGVGATALAGLGLPQETTAQVPRWDRVTDVVVVGSGASGLPAALRARDGSATVIIVEANSDIGGHAMMSGGSVALGGGTTHQKKYGIEDSPDQVYLENTDPSHPLTSTTTERWSAPLPTTMWKPTIFW